ncbi:MAG: aldehyde dehydrogenase family protein [Candidatus Eisenbacteria bacterium]
MSRLTDEQIGQIAGILASRAGARGVAFAPTATLGEAEAAPSPPHSIPPHPPSPTPSPAQSAPGVYADVGAAVSAARLAFLRLSREKLELRERIISAMRTLLLQEAEALARLAHEETGYGRYEDKIIKNRVVTGKTPGLEDLRPEAVSGDRGLTLVEPAPYGVIGAITPVTNPSSTVINNAIGMLAAGNSVVFNCHPSARRVGCRTVEVINEAVMSAGGPADLAVAIAEPTIASAQALMKHPDVRLLVVTGGAGVVAQAMASGKRAICAGPGNPPVVVDESADLDRAGRDIVLGASFDNNIICVDEKEVFVVASVADALLDSLVRHGAYRLDPARLPQLERVIFESLRGPREPGQINKELIGKNAEVILARLGLSARPETRLVVVEVPPEHPLVWTEQMMPVLPIVRAPDAERAIDMAIAAERGMRHTAAMHSRNLDHLSRMAREIDCSIFIKNGPCYAGLGAGGEGHSSFTIASPTGEGLTGPRSFSRLRRCVLVDHFRIV